LLLRRALAKLRTPAIEEVRFMRSTAKALLGLSLLIGASAAFGQTYNMTLTGVGNGTVSEGVYVTPYVGTITGNGFSYSGFIICDDFNTESYVNSSWTATMTNAGNLDGAQKFFTNNSSEAQIAYNAAGWLANGLLANYGNTTAQVDYAFAIWNIFDGQQMNPNGNSLSLEQQAFAAALGGYTASNVSVFTPNPVNASQEFLVVNAQAPEIDPSVATSGATLLIGASLIFASRRKREQ
jgi:hypothetical protein